MASGRSLPRPIEVKVTTFGGFSLEVDGRPILARDWKAANARWLFLYLALRKGEEIAQDQLREIFWPASSAIKGHRALLTSVYRARKALGHHHLIERVDQAYRLGECCQLWLDVKEFVECHRRQKGADGPNSDWVQRMNALYKGPFVPEYSDLWCATMRQELAELNREAKSFAGSLKVL
jgi:DNA-binding SARP family transcriptional activator